MRVRLQRRLTEPPVARVGLGLQYLKIEGAGARSCIGPRSTVHGPRRDADACSMDQNHVRHDMWMMSLVRHTLFTAVYHRRARRALIERTKKTVIIIGFAPPPAA